jgi:hypothetical protein
VIHESAWTSPVVMAMLLADNLPPIAGPGREGEILVKRLIIGGRTHFPDQLEGLNTHRHRTREVIQLKSQDL